MGAFLIPERSDAVAREADFSELEKFFKNWQDAYKDFDEFLKKFLLEMALRAIAKIKPKTPVDTGALRNMWGIGSQEIVLRAATESTVEIDPERSTIASIDVIGNNFEVVIWNGMDYASFVEFGARNVDGSWRDGYFMMTISISEVERAMPARFDKAFKSYLQAKGAA